jgi:NAD dependent epimerase/dehydratase family enzyme
MTDLCQIFLKALENDTMTGVYNGVAPNPVTNKELNKAIAKALHRPLFLPPVPVWALKIMLGEMHGIVVTGARVTCDKIKAAGVDFQFDNAQAAIRDLLP